MKREKIKGTARSRIKRGDEVVFVAGKEFNRYDSDGKRSPYRGKVIAVDPRTGRIKVDGAMIVKRHKKAVPQMNVQGGIIKMEAWVDISNVAVVDPDTGNPSRVKYEIRDGEKIRVAKSGAVIPEPAVYVKAEKEVGDEAPVEEAITEETATEEAVETPAEDSKKDDSEEE
jgi:large subunit ribosomal protein L24